MIYYVDQRFISRIKKTKQDFLNRFFNRALLKALAKGMMIASVTINRK